MGLANLQWVNRIVEEKRKNLMIRYENKLVSFKAYRPVWHSHSENNGAYLPFVIESEELLLKIKQVLDDNEIFTRRYFYPSLSTSLPYIPTVQMPISDDISKRVLCLPLYYDLTLEEVDWICKLY
jgi:dTDP-4-amino-4,6-dideoxygalactose transaminase